MTKMFLWMIVFMLNLTIVKAQTGLFDTGIAGTFATTGIVIIVVIIIFKEMFKRFFSKK